jgi:hypothetical protein
VVSILRSQQMISILLLAIFLLGLGLRVYFVTRYLQPELIKDTGEERRQWLRSGSRAPRALSDVFRLYSVSDRRLLSFRA